MCTELRWFPNVLQYCIIMLPWLLIVCCLHLSLSLRLHDAILLPEYTYSLTSSIFISPVFTWFSIFALIFIILVFSVFMFRAISFTLFGHSSVLLWVSWWRCGSKAISSASSKSSSDSLSVQVMPLLLFLVVSFINQSKQTVKSNGDNIQPCFTPVCMGKSSVS